MGQDTRIENSKGRVGSTNPNHPGSLGSKLKTKKILILMLNSFLEPCYDRGNFICLIQ